MKLIINNDVFQKMSHWVAKAPGEISGLGIIQVEKEGILRVTKTILLEQKNGSTSTDITPEAICKAMYDFRNEPQGSLRWWWHSHVNMAVFWSGTDTATIRELGGSGPDSWLVATVINKKSEWKNAVYVHEGQKTPWGKESLFLDDISAEIATVPNPDVPLWDAEYERCCKKEEIIHKPWEGYGYCGNPQWTKVTGAGNTNTSTTNEVTKSLGLLSAEAIAAAEKAQYASGRPTGMTKRVWAEIKKQQRVREAKEIKEKQTATIVSPGANNVDAYGFTQAEWTFLAEEGFDQNFVDYLHEQDFTPLEILRLAELSMEDSQTNNMAIKELITTGYMPEQVIEFLEATAMEDDLPVADRRHQWLS